MTQTLENPGPAPEPERSRRDLLARSLTELRAARSELAALEARACEPIAIVGLGCRLPGGADSPDALWELLRDGIDATSEPPPGRWDPSADEPAWMYTRRGGYLDSVDRFDARFFGVSQREAACLDPQQRLLLEVAWEALEHGAIAPDRLRDTNTGVFFGVSVSDYGQLLTAHTPTAELDGFVGSGVGLNFGAGRVAHFLGLRGPAMVIDTACSSSLVAVHQACASLRAGECDLALSGGVNLILSPLGHAILCRAQVLSPEGRCKTFSADANGYARAEGCGVVVLRRLSDARREGDRVLAVIRGSAVNQDGPSSGLMVPNPRAQRELVEAALANAGVEASAIAYVEAHGTATALGDPIEVRALADALGHGREQPLLLGALKANLGHLEAAAGIAGLIKLTLCLDRGELPRQLHAAQLNPNIDWDRLPVAIVDRHREWPVGPRLAGLSAFGASGTNAHLVLEAAPSQPQVESSPAPEFAARVNPRRPALLILSAHHRDGLVALATATADRLVGEDPTRAPLRLEDLCHTAAHGRARLPEVFVSVAEDHTLLAQRLRRFATNAAPGPEWAVGRRPRRGPRVAFVFSGQGSQRVGMGRELLAHEPCFRAAIERCDAHLRPLIGHSLLDLLSGHGDAAELEASFARTELAQPLLVGFEWALAELWRSFGVVPELVLGHSLGEYTAACVAGVSTIEQTLTLVARRGQLVQAHAGRDGAMVAVFCGETRVRRAIAGREGALSIAAVNGPTETVISGREAAVLEVAASLAAHGIETKQLRSSFGFHSALVDPVCPPFAAALAELAPALRRPEIALVSNLDGAFIDEGICEPDYFCRHLREPVRFADGLRTLLARDIEHVIEIGPGVTLSAIGRRLADSSETTPEVRWLPSLRPDHGERRSMLTSLAALVVAGLEPRWDAVLDPGRRVALPLTPFRRQRHWFDTSTGPSPRRGADQTRTPERDPNNAEPPIESLLGLRADDPPPAGVAFENRLRPDGPAVLREHRVYGRMVVSGAVHAAMIEQAITELHGDATAFVVHEVEFCAPLLLAEDRDTRTRLELRPEGTGERVELTTVDPRGARTRITTALVSPRGPGEPPPAPDLDALRKRCTELLEGPAFYARFWRAGEHELGPCFQTITQIYRRDGEALARLRPPPVDPAEGLDPALARGVALSEVYGQILMPAIHDYAETLASLEHTFLGHGMDRVIDYAGAPERARWAHASLRSFDGDELRGDVTLLDEAGEVLSVVEGLRARRVPASFLRLRLAAVAAAVPSFELRGLEGQTPARARARLATYVAERVAALVGGEPDFAGDEPLAHLGFDSLMIIELHRDLHLGLTVEPPDPSTLLAITLDALVDELGMTLMRRYGDPGRAEQARPAAHPRLRRLTPGPVDREAPRLVCLVDRDLPDPLEAWLPALAGDRALEVVTLSFGAEELRRITPARIQIAAATASAIDPILELSQDGRGLALFGFGLGARLALALARELRHRGAQGLERLFVCGAPGPAPPSRASAYAGALSSTLALGGRRVRELSALATRSSLTELPLERDTWSAVSGSIARELDRLWSRRREREAPLSLPIVALGDPSLATWSAHGSAGFVLHHLPRHPGALAADPLEVLSRIRRELCHPLDPFDPLEQGPR